MDRNTSFYKKNDQPPIKIQNGQFYTCCINMYGDNPLEWKGLRKVPASIWLGTQCIKHYFYFMLILLYICRYMPFHFYLDFICIDLCSRLFIHSWLVSYLFLSVLQAFNQYSYMIENIWLLLTIAMQFS